MPGHTLPAAMLCRAALLVILVSVSMSSRANEVPQYGLANCFQASNPSALSVSYTSLLAVATDPAFERTLCQVDTKIPIAGIFEHFVLPNGSWLVATRAGLYTFDINGMTSPLGLEAAVGTTGVALGPNGSVAVTTANHIAIVDLEKPSVERLLKAAGNNTPHFLPDGTLLLGQNDKVVQVSADSGQEVRTITVGDEVSDITRRADGVIVVKTLAEVILFDEDLQEYARFATRQGTHPCLRPRRSESRC